MKRSSPGLALLAACIAMLSSSAMSAAATGPIGSDFRISTTGADGATTPAASLSALAYNSVANEYLVVWKNGDRFFGSNVDSEIYGQRVSAAGAELGSDFRISNTGPEGDTNRNSERPQVAYNSTANEYLVVWQGDGGATDSDDEIWGQRVSAAGAEVGPDFQISTTAAGDVLRSAREPSLAYNSTANEYLVAWGANPTGNSAYDVWGQRLSGAGAELGVDFQISNSPDTGNGIYPAVTYGSGPNEYLVTWSDYSGSRDDEIYGQRVTAAGVETGAEFGVSTTPGSPDAVGSSNAYNPVTNEYLVAWNVGLSGPGPYDLEVYGQRVSGSGAELGGDIRISNNGTDGDVNRQAYGASVAFNSAANEFLVTFQADELATDDEFELFGQRLSPAGTELDADFRISNVGADNDASRGVTLEAAVAANPTANEYLAVFSADGLATDDELEVFGRRVGAGTGGGGGASNQFTLGKVKRNKKKGTATQTVDVPGPGTLNLAGAGLKSQRPLGRPGSTGPFAKPVTAAGSVDLLIKATGNKKKKLKKKGKVKVKPTITFTPTGGTAASQTTSLKLKKQRKK